MSVEVSIELEMMMRGWEYVRDAEGRRGWKIWKEKSLLPSHVYLRMSLFSFRNPSEDTDCSQLLVLAESKRAKNNG